MKEKQTNEYQNLAMRICNILDDNKATDINLIDISKTSNVDDYFIVFLQILPVISLLCL